MKKSTEGDEIFHFFRCPVRNAGPLWTIYRMHVFPSYVAYMYATWNKKSRVVEYKLNDFHFFIFYILNVCVLCIIDTYTIFDGLTHNTRGYFASCEIFSEPRVGRRKIRAISKIRAFGTLSTKNLHVELFLANQKKFLESFQKHCDFALAERRDCIAFEVIQLDQIF